MAVSSGFEYAATFSRPANMTRSNSLKTGAGIGLIAISCYFLTDSFRSKTIQIIPASRPVGAWREGAQAAPLSFALDSTYALTSIKVVPVSALQPNRVPVPCWQLITKSNSAPIRGFAYGTALEGMESPVTKKSADDLQPGETYRLLVEAGNIKGQVDFKAAPAIALLQ